MYSDELIKCSLGFTDKTATVLAALELHIISYPFYAFACMDKMAQLSKALGVMFIKCSLGFTDKIATVLAASGATLSRSRLFITPSMHRIHRQYGPAVQGAGWKQYGPAVQGARLGDGSIPQYGPAVQGARLGDGSIPSIVIPYAFELISFLSRCSAMSKHETNGPTVQGARWKGNGSNPQHGPCVLDQVPELGDGSNPQYGPAIQGASHGGRAMVQIHVADKNATVFAASFSMSSLSVITRSRICIDNMAQL
ncbi:uncharacterized protein LACBIDRAFT_330119 [Laccaria bicolor S238N-H82]|uniref:Predicted protein n=1 Tax=Laccaria bicolor (strain S238N-H82 / ATCC MYA-4686) TaxID=486041 RepID=B0DKC9_LACBS|nr:uncharacterized protein LACBIDRAFT_330119 [Laccaria bicolor S238N-H82]EDR04920.1 predicted protein [Laccaria bicolor S238N-H82]|eukprot:XP_001884310.1 predicted protein [Laccaria bicolor S238N-H82]